MATNRKRKMRVSKNHIPLNITASYLEGLCCDAFLEEGRQRDCPSKLTPEEHELVREYEHCDMDFEKWLKFRERKIERAKKGK